MIPKIIHHVWPGSDPFKEKFYNFRMSWMKHHPDWTFCFWRLDNLPDTINCKIGKILSNSEYAITPKSDLLRFEIIRLYGGIYVDTDMECLKSFDQFRNFSFFAGFEDDGKTICPSLIGAEADNILIKKTLDLSLHNLQTKSIQETNKNPNKITGVQPFSDTILANSLTPTNIRIFPKHSFYHIGYKERNRLDETHPDAYAKHYWSGKEQDGWTNIIKF